MKTKIICSLILCMSLHFYAQTTFGNEIYGQIQNSNIGHRVEISKNGNTMCYTDFVQSERKMHVMQLVNNQWVLKGNPFGNNVSNINVTDFAISDNGNIVVFQDINFAVKVFQYINNDWVQMGNDFIYSGAHSMHGVALSSDGLTVAIGEIATTDNFGSTAVYQYSNNTWIQKGQLLNSEIFTERPFGGRVSLSNDGNVLAIGNFNMDNSFAGRVLVYQFSNGTWSLKGNEIIGEQNNAQLGVITKISADGNILAVGSYQGSINNSGGYLDMYQYNNNTNQWSLMGSRIIGEVGEHLGRGFDMSDDGLTIGVGVPNFINDTGKVGKVLSYQYLNNDWNVIFYKEGYPDVSFSQWVGYGSGIALDNNASKILIGINGDDTVASNAGKIEGYLLDGNTTNVHNNTTIMFSVYPNPTTDKLHIIDIDNTLKKIEIYNNIGQKIIQSEQKENTIDVSTLQKGLYHLNIIQKGKIVHSKFIKS